MIVWEGVQTYLHTPNRNLSFNRTNQTSWLKRERGRVAICRAEEVDTAFEVLQPLRKGVRNIPESVKECGLGSVRGLVPPVHARTTVVHVDDSRKRDEDVCRKVAMHGRTILGVGNKLNERELAPLLKAAHSDMPVLVDVDVVDGERGTKGDFCGQMTVDADETHDVGVLVGIDWFGT